MGSAAQLRPPSRHKGPSPTSSAVGASRFRRFLHDFGALLFEAPEEECILRDGGRLLERLVAFDDWLAPAFAAADPQRYRQNLLYCDCVERFSVVAFVWGPGQSTPVHNHTVWGLVGVLRGAEISQSYEKAGRRLTPLGPEQHLHAGQVTVVSPTVGDWHRVANAHADRPSISIHVYGGNIGRIRRTACDDAGQRNAFVSGYSNGVLPNPWFGA
jgi:predicted metal-dependent enzyme (double-stranded beta helix superfamily)